MTAAEKTIIRNQRYIMLALACLHRNVGGMLSGLHADELMNRVKDMDRTWDWIAPPPKRISE